MDRVNHCTECGTEIALGDMCNRCEMRITLEFERRYQFQLMEV